MPPKKGGNATGWVCIQKGNTKDMHCKEGNETEKVKKSVGKRWKKVEKKK